jgi:uncharacterized membrane protein YedE/YeeE
MQSIASLQTTSSTTCAAAAVLSSRIQRRIPASSASSKKNIIVQLARKKAARTTTRRISAHHGPDYIAKFEPENAAGGGLILAAAILGRYLSTGKAIGCSGLVSPFSMSGISKAALDTKLPLFAGIVATPLVLPYLGLAHLLPAGGYEVVEGTSRLVLAMLLVGFGSKLGDGCTSGHGLSGIGRLSVRSVANVCTFMAFGALAATMFNTNALLHVVTETGKGKAVTAVNAIANTVSATQADKALYGKILASAFAGYATIGYLAKNNIIIKRGSQAADIVKSVVHGATGILFGVGLVVSQMVNPAKVSTFLQFTQSTWDPSLGFVMGAALAAIIPGILIIKNQLNNSTFGDPFQLPDPVTAAIDAKLIVGGAIFGTGWGLAGMCPGPLFVNVGAALSNQTLSATSGCGLALLCFWVGQSLARVVQDVLSGSA